MAIFYAYCLNIFLKIFYSLWIVSYTVINVTLPDEKQNYVHRIGRVGRAERYVCVQSCHHVFLIHYYHLLVLKLAAFGEMIFFLRSSLIFQDGFGNLPCGKRERKGNN